MSSRIPSLRAGRGIFETRLSSISVARSIRFTFIRGVECQQGLSPISINASPHEHPLCNLALPSEGISRDAFLGRNVTTANFLRRLARDVFDYGGCQWSCNSENYNAKNHSRAAEGQSPMQTGRDARSSRNLQKSPLIITSSMYFFVFRISFENLGLISSFFFHFCTSFFIFEKYL